MLSATEAQREGAMRRWRVELTDNERNHGRSISPGGLEALNQLLDLPDLDLMGNGLLATGPM